MPELRPRADELTSAQVSALTVASDRLRLALDEQFARGISVSAWREPDNDDVLAARAEMVAAYVAAGVAPARAREATTSWETLKYSTPAEALAFVDEHGR